MICEQLLLSFGNSSHSYPVAIGRAVSTSFRVCVKVADFPTSDIYAYSYVYGEGWRGKQYTVYTFESRIRMTVVFMTFSI